MANAGRVELTEDQRARLEEMARSRTLEARKVLRAKIILRRANGESFRDIGMALSCDHRTAWKCVKRWEAAGFEGIEKEQAGRGRKLVYPQISRPSERIGAGVPPPSTEAGGRFGAPGAAQELRCHGHAGRLHATVGHAGVFGHELHAPGLGLEVVA